MTITPTAGVPDRTPGPQDQGADPDGSAAAEFMAALAAAVFPVAPTAPAPGPVPAPRPSPSGREVSRPRVERRTEREAPSATGVETRRHDRSRPAAGQGEDRAPVDRSQAPAGRDRAERAAQDRQAAERTRTADGPARPDAATGHRTSGEVRGNGAGEGSLSARLGTVPSPRDAAPAGPATAEGQRGPALAGSWSEPVGVDTAGLPGESPASRLPGDVPRTAGHAGHAAADRPGPVRPGAPGGDLPDAGAAGSDPGPSPDGAQAPGPRALQQPARPTAAVPSSGAVAGQPAQGTVRVGDPAAPAAQEGSRTAGVSALQGPSQNGRGQLSPAPGVARGSAATRSQADPDAASDVIDQVARHLTAVRTLRDGTHRTVLNLSPKHLGSVQVTVDLLDGQVSLRLAAGDAALAALRQDMSDLRAQLSQVGLELADVDLHSWSADRQAAGQQAADRQATGQQATGQQGSGSERPDGAPSPAAQDPGPPAGQAGERHPRPPQDPDPDQAPQNPGTAPGRRTRVDLRV